MMLLVHGAPKVIWRRPLPHFGHLIHPGARNVAVFRSGYPWACENGAFSRWDSAAFLRMLDRVPRSGCLYVACPDVVGRAKETLGQFWLWGPQIRERNLPVALVAQDGIEDLDVPWNWFQAFFVGSSDEFKESRTACDVSREAKRRGKWLHMGRVNSKRRMRHAFDLGCDSIDGSKFNKWADRWLLPGLGYIGQLHAQRLVT